MRYRPLETLIALLAVASVVGAVLGTVLLVRHAAEGQSSAQPPPSPSPTQETRPPADPLPPALAVKIDNTDGGHTGLGPADAIYVEPVEAGLTRLVAVYWNERPAVVGPVRSIRQTDVELLAQFEGPVLANSGSASALRPHVEDSDIRSISPEAAPGAFHRDMTRPVPHNLFARGDQLPATDNVEEHFDTGEAPDGGDSAGEYRVSYEAAFFGFRWSEQDERWLVTLNGSPLSSAEYGQLDADTVAVQRVPTETGLGITDARGNLSPFARTVGEGSATVLRDGRVYEGSWSRETAEQPTTFSTESGETIPFGDGRVWILVVPA